MATRPQYSIISRWLLQLTLWTLDGLPRRRRPLMYRSSVRLQSSQLTISYTVFVRVRLHVSMICCWVQSLLEQCANEDPDTEYNKACVLYKVREIIFLPWNNTYRSLFGMRPKRVKKVYDEMLSPLCLRFDCFTNYLVTVLAVGSHKTDVQRFKPNRTTVIKLIILRH